jgi:hypothetical protein
MSIYRAKKNADIGSFREMVSRDTRRPPGNVPYVVDNLWEWTRPENYPDRRRSKFANPTPEQALRSAGLPENAYEHVFRVEFFGDPIIAQIDSRNGEPEKDAKYHSDCRRLRKLLIDKLDGEGGKFSWPTKDLEEKYPAGQLFQPCLTSEEVEQVFESADELSPLDKEKITYWNDLALIGPDSLANDRGEILFEFRDPGEGDGYWRRPVER